jgi:hypothetical protein
MCQNLKPLTSRDLPHSHIFPEMQSRATDCYIAKASWPRRACIRIEHSESRQIKEVVPLSLSWRCCKEMPSITSRGSITFPRLLDIFLPWASRTMLCKYTVWKGTWPAHTKFLAETQVAQGEELAPVLKPKPRLLSTTLCQVDPSIKSMQKGHIAEYSEHDTFLLEISLREGPNLSTPDTAGPGQTRLSTSQNFSVCDNLCATSNIKSQISNIKYQIHLCLTSTTPADA